MISCVQLQDIAAMTQKLKNQTINTLEKANKLSKELKESNKNLTEFIEKIKNFLTGMWMILLQCLNVT